MFETAFEELAKRWHPILDAYEDAGVDLCYEIHPSEDLFDGTTFEMFLDRVKGHRRANILFDPSHFVLQQLNYLEYIDIFHERIKMFHVKDAEFNPTGRQGVYSGYAPWLQRAGRFRSVGDGQVDFKGIFSKLAGYDYEGWAVLEWECCIKDSVQGAIEGAPFIASHIIKTTEKSFDDFVAGSADKAKINQIPDLTGMKSEVIVQKAHRFPYDHGIRNTGVKIVEFETRAEAEKLAIRSPVQRSVHAEHVAEMARLAVVERFGEQAPKILILSSGSNFAENTSAAPIGIERYLTKPVKQSDLFNAITRALGSVTSAEMRALADYFAANKPAQQPFKPDPEKAKLGKAKADETLCTKIGRAHV